MAEKRTYRPSWIDHLLNWVDSLPFPPAVFFILLYVLCVLGMNVPLWLEGAYPPGQFVTAFFFDATWLPFVTGFIYLMNGTAESAIASFRPMLDVSDVEFDEIAYRFRTLPRVPILIFSLLGLAVGISESAARHYVFAQPGMPTFSEITWYIFNNSAFIFLPVWFYFAFRQLVQVNRLFGMVKKVNLFDLQQLYGLTSVTLVVGSFFLALANLNYVIEVFGGTASLTNEETVNIYLINVGVALLMVILPLYGIHNKINREKRNVLSELGQQVESLRNDLQADVSGRKFENIQGLERSLTALFNLRGQVQAIPAWPWQPGSLRNFLSAIGLPLFIWLMQRVLSQYF
ncbi:MAG: hypothetical protein EPO32_04055 [Anaerolineae bacterium]|nr:MAG: hypothetical protein EPO32_04055 [Anaerolineae bacterium]